MPTPENKAKKKLNRACLVVFSGGQDSATCLAWALDRYPHVETIGFRYGQRHAIEMTCREPLRAAMASPRLGADHVVDLTGTLAGLGATALTSEAAIAMTAEGLPNTFVPGRNLIFLAFAAALAYRRGLGHVVGGMCETDYSGYPDCRPEYYDAFNQVIARGTAKGDIKIKTPIIYLTKEQIIQKGVDLDAPLHLTWSCYQNNDVACGVCDSCALRLRGFQRAGLKDPLEYELRPVY